MPNSQLAKTLKTTVHRTVGQGSWPAAGPQPSANPPTREAIRTCAAISTRGKVPSRDRKGAFSTLLLTLLLTALPASAADQPPGKTLYIDKYMCYTCHGYSGQNGPGAPLVPMKMSQEAFIAYVRNPKQPNRMPSFSVKVVSDTELGEIYSYIKSLPNSHPDPKTVPLLKDLLK